jgi:hypothetical protein
MNQMNLFATKTSQPVYARAARQVKPDTEVADLRFEVKSLWIDEAPFHDSPDTLATYIGDQLGVNTSVIRAWRSLYEWPLPSGQSQGKQSIWQIEDDDDPLMHACDQMEPFYNQRRTSGHRKMVAKYVETTGFNSPSEIDLKLVQDILNRHPITLRSLAVGLGQEPDIFPVYAAANGVVEPSHAKINIPLGNLMFHHEGFATYIIRHVQHLYYYRGIPIRTMANRIGINWRDLWLFGVRFGYWRMPSAHTMTMIDEFISHRKVG